MMVFQILKTIVGLLIILNKRTETLMEGLIYISFVFHSEFTYYLFQFIYSEVTFAKKILMQMESWTSWIIAQIILKFLQLILGLFHLKIKLL